MDQETTRHKLDIPLRGHAGDLAGRYKLSKEFLEYVKSFELAEGAVVGVRGKWGSGKSSFLNMVKEELKIQSETIIVDFNPWLFSGTNQLVEHFFLEISRALGKEKNNKLQSLSSWFEEYSSDLSPVFALLGPPGNVTLSVFKIAAKRKNKSKPKTIEEKKNQISDGLKSLDQPIYVFVDDLDRLTAEEIREILKLVRLTASFPNIVYVLAFDRAIVEKALSSDGITGSEYLEKIIQVVYDLPGISTQVLDRKLLEELTLLHNSCSDLIPLDSERWGDVYYQVLLANVSNFRDINRFVNSSRMTIQALSGTIQFADLVALETIRIFHPKVFEVINNSRDLLTTSYRSKPQQTKIEMQPLVQGIVELGGDSSGSIATFLKLVFPEAFSLLTSQDFVFTNSQNFRAKRRFADRELLSLYLDRNVSELINTFISIEDALSYSEDKSKFDAFFDQIKKHDLYDAINAIRDLASEMSLLAKTNVITAIMNKTADIPTPVSNSFLAPTGSSFVRVIVLQLLQDIPVSPGRENLILDVFSQIHGLSDKLNLILLVGHQEGMGHGLISKEIDSKLKNVLVAQIENSAPTNFSLEWDLWRVINFYREETGALPNNIDFEKPEVIRGLFTSLSSEIKSQTSGSNQIQVQPTIAWDLLTSILESKEIIEKCLNTLQSVDGETDLVKLVRKYLDGWRPENFFGHEIAKP